MAVGFKVKYYWFQVGTGDFLHALFSNICYHLENKQWGSKYPILMNKLYNGHLCYEESENALLELEDIYNNLSQISYKNLIWDIENVDLRPPWGDKISSDITNLGNYFITSDGDDLIHLLKKAIIKSKDIKSDLYIKSI